MDNSGKSIILGETLLKKGYPPNPLPKTFHYQKLCEMKSFSQRMGLKPVKSIIQSDSMDEELRNGLWNLLFMHYLDEISKRRHIISGRDKTRTFYFFVDIWDLYFKLPLYNLLENSWLRAYEDIKNYFFECEWFEVYDFIEFIANNYFDKSTNETFLLSCNDLFKRELSGYRFIDGKIAPITSEEEIAEIEKAINIPVSPVKEHLNTSLELFSDRKNPQYRNSIDESIKAVESLCKIITGDENATLAQALKKLKRDGKIELHNALKEGFIKIYGYTSDADGIRHGLSEESNLDSEDARFMLISCSSFINYLSSKSAKAGINIKV